MPESVGFPSGSTGGLPIVIQATNVNAAGTLLHTAHPTIAEEVYLWVANSGTVAVDFTLQYYSGATFICAKSGSIPPREFEKGILPGQRLSSVSIYGVASIAGALVASLNINRTA